jgi:hypothetical protein
MSGTVCVSPIIELLICDRRAGGRRRHRRQMRGASMWQGLARGAACAAGHLLLQLLLLLVLNGYLVRCERLRDHSEDALGPQALLDLRVAGPPAQLSSGSSSSSSSSSSSQQQQQRGRRGACCLLLAEPAPAAVDQHAPER